MKRLLILSIVHVSRIREAVFQPDLTTVLDVTILACLPALAGIQTRVEREDAAPNEAHSGSSYYPVEYLFHESPALETAQLSDYLTILSDGYPMGGRQAVIPLFSGGAVL